MFAFLCLIYHVQDFFKILSLYLELIWNCIKQLPDFSFNSFKHWVQAIILWGFFPSLPQVFFNVCVWNYLCVLMHAGFCFGGFFFIFICLGFFLGCWAFLRYAALNKFLFWLWLFFFLSLTSPEKY